MNTKPTKETTLTHAEDNPWYKLFLKTIDIDKDTEQPHGWCWFWNIYFLHEATPEFPKFDITTITDPFLGGQNVNHYEASYIKLIQHTLNKNADELTDITKSLKEHNELDFSNLIFKNYVDFSKIIFPINVSFRNTVFSKGVKFLGAKFYGVTDFTKTIFGGVYVNDANFQDAKFFDSIRFSEAKLSSGGNFQNTQFLRDVNFNKTKFSTKANFNKAKFLKDAAFNNAKFFDDVYFNDAVFCETADFENTEFQEKESHRKETAKFRNTTFKKIANFRNATFWGYANFKGAKLEGRAFFQKAKFKCHAPRFYDATFNNEMTWAGIELPDLAEAPVDNYDTIGNKIILADYEKIIENHSRRIEENQNSYENTAILLEQQGKYHDRHFFFRHEMRCRRWLEGNFNRITYGIYELLADYGYGVGRALLGWFLNICFWAWMLSVFVFDKTPSPEKLKCSFLTSLSNAHSFFLSKGERLSSCYDKKTAADKTTLAFDSIWAIETMFGALFLFLLLLTLRVRFRLGSTTSNTTINLSSEK